MNHDLKNPDVVESESASPAKEDVTKTIKVRPVFSGALNREDILLYTFCAALLVFMAGFFWQTQNQLAQVLISEQMAGPPLVASEGAEKNTPYNAYLITQTINSSKRYQQGARVLMTTSTRKNTGFLVGSLLAFMGCIIVIRRVRGMGFNAEGATSTAASFKLATSSPGLLIAFLGSLIILSTIVRYDSFDIQDAVVYPPGALSPETINPQPKVTSGTPEPQATRQIPEDVRKEAQELIRKADLLLKEKKQ